MPTLVNPALSQFIALLGEELVFAQVLIRRAGPGFELRHVDDRDCSVTDLKELAVAELRATADFTETGAFRPLKSAPNLKAGWRVLVAGVPELELALEQLYHGALADWFAARKEVPPVTGYREFTNRQTGMYRITQMLSDEQAGQVIRVGCHARFCLKRRLWTVTGLAIDMAESKSVIPCLEPCAILLEFARKAMRLEQEEKPMAELTPVEQAALMTALEATVAQPVAGVREADFGDPGNPRVAQLTLDKLRAQLKLDVGGQAK